MFSEFSPCTGAISLAQEREGKTARRCGHGQAGDQAHEEPRRKDRSTSGIGNARPTSSLLACLSPALAMTTVRSGWAEARRCGADLSSVRVPLHSRPALRLNTHGGLWQAKHPTMSALIRLPNGIWIDPAAVTSIAPMPPETHQHREEVRPSRVVITYQFAEPSHLYCESWERAQALADELATQVNAARSSP